MVFCCSCASNQKETMVSVKGTTWELISDMTNQGGGEIEVSEYH